MPKKKNKKKLSLEELIKNLIIVQLRLAGLGQGKIRKIVGGDIYSVTRITRYLKIKEKK
jgi:hypothetical protein